MLKEENFQHEEYSEKIGFYKTIYYKLKQFHEKLPKEIQEKYSNFPLFWQDLENWKHAKYVIKLYLTYEEKGNSNINIMELDHSLSQMNTMLSFNSNTCTSIDTQSKNIPVQVQVQVSDCNGKDSVNDFNNYGKELSNINESNADGNTMSTSTYINSNTMESSGDGNVNVIPKKKRNRWDADISISNNSNNDINITNDSTNPIIESLPTMTSNEETKKVRKSRFAPIQSNDTNKKPIEMTPEIVQQIILLKMKLQTINNKLLTVTIDAARIEQDPNRSPSPTPKYDSNGKRTNTREMRMREEYLTERTQTIEELIRIDCNYVPPSDYQRQKPFKKLYIPIKEFPTYNFLGLLIGPRGNTQKKLESDYLCKISIRGRGSVKDGFRNKLNASKQSIEDEDDELHCFIQGDEEWRVEMCAHAVKQLLTPIDDERNEHKQKQLRELALINGTLKEDEYCPICGDKGHRQWECTNRTKTFKAANVKCAICGELSHPTRDCPLKTVMNDDGYCPEVSLDREYSSFMAELDNGGNKTTTQSIEDILATSDEVIVTSNNKKQTILQAPSVPEVAIAKNGKQQTIIMQPFELVNPPPKMSNVPLPTAALPMSTPVWNGYAYVTPVPATYNVMNMGMQSMTGAYYPNYYPTAPIPSIPTWQPPPPPSK